MTGGENDFEFAYAVKRDAFGPYVVPKWGWDECFQRKVMVERLGAKRFFRILLDGTAVGTIAIDDEPDHIRVGEFYILPSAQNQGIGGEVLRPILANATDRKLPVRLECLKWNPALSFYRRHGIEPTHESETHVFLERSPNGDG
jgi:GNAT superfamily N-acetyltransferase